LIPVSDLIRGEAKARPIAYTQPRAWARPIVVWNLTRTCNLRCVHCYANAANKRFDQELTTDECFEVIDELAEYGVPAILFSGGEPLMRKDVLWLIGYARKKGLRAVLSTNGTRLTRDVVERLKEAGVSYVGVSLDGIGRLHDELRGRKGAFEASVKGIRNCVRAGVKVGIRFTANKLNVHHLSALLGLMMKERVDRFCLYHMVPTGRASALERVALTLGETRLVITQLFQESARILKEHPDKEILTVDNHCDGCYFTLWSKKYDEKMAENAFRLLRYVDGNQSGVKLACIDYLGNVFADQFSWNYSFGNVRRQSFVSIWEGKDRRLEMLRNRARYLKGRCRFCKFLPICNGNLRARAERYFGDFLAPDPGCYLGDEEIGISDEVADTEEFRTYRTPIQLE